MNKIVQHRPAYFDGFEKEVVPFATTEELLAISFVARFRELDGFHRYSVCRDHPPMMLMAEVEEGRTWWVIGHLDDDCPDLPTWMPVR